MAPPNGRRIFALGCKTFYNLMEYPTCNFSNFNGLRERCVYIDTKFVKTYQTAICRNCGPKYPAASLSGRYMDTLPLKNAMNLLEVSSSGFLTKKLSDMHGTVSQCCNYGTMRSALKTSTIRSQSRPKRPYGGERDLWNLRLANENGYLSSCRNAYISVIAGATVYGQHGLVAYGQEAGVLLIWLGGINLFWGTGLFLYHCIKLRRLTSMSRFSLAIHCAMALTHMFIWIGAMAIYLEYVEEEDGKKEI